MEDHVEAYAFLMPFRRSTIETMLGGAAYRDQTGVSQCRHALSRADSIRSISTVISVANLEGGDTSLRD